MKASLGNRGFFLHSTPRSSAAQTLGPCPWEPCVLLAVLMLVGLQWHSLSYLWHWRFVSILRLLLSQTINYTDSSKPRFGLPWFTFSLGLFSLLLMMVWVVFFFSFFSSFFSSSDLLLFLFPNIFFFSNMCKISAPHNFEILAAYSSRYFYKHFLCLLSGLWIISKCFVSFPNIRRLSCHLLLIPGLIPFWLNNIFWLNKISTHPTC